MNLKALLSLPLNLVALLTNRLASHTPKSLTSASLSLTSGAHRAASTMAIDNAKLNVNHQPLQPHTKPGDSSHPTGFMRDGYCWGIQEDPGRHYVAGIVTTEFLQFSKDRGNDLMTQRGGFPGLKDGCRWCLCVARWKEAFTASQQLGDKVVPRVDLNATALDALKTVKLEDLQRFASTRD